jgi:ankyrin repeat protein
MLSPSGWSSLHFAAADGSDSSVRILLDAGADCNIWRGLDVPSPLAVALSVGASAETAHRLLDCSDAHSRRNASAMSTVDAATVMLAAA